MLASDRAPSSLNMLNFLYNLNAYTKSEQLSLFGVLISSPIYDAMLLVCSGVYLIEQKYVPGLIKKEA